MLVGRAPKCCAGRCWVAVGCWLPCREFLGPEGEHGRHMGTRCSDFWCWVILRLCSVYWRAEDIVKDVNGKPCVGPAKGSPPQPSAPCPCFFFGCWSIKPAGFLSLVCLGFSFPLHSGTREAAVWTSLCAFFCGSEWGKWRLTLPAPALCRQLMLGGRTGKQNPLRDWKEWLQPHRGERAKTRDFISQK